MSNPPRRERWAGLGDQLRGSSQVRLSDDEREGAVRELNEHFATGRLTATEHHQRSEQAWAARTRGDLAPLFRDLPTRPDVRGGQYLRPGSPYAQQPRQTRRRGGLPTPVVVLIAIIGAMLLLANLPILLLIGIAWLIVSSHTRNRRTFRYGGGWQRR